MMLLLSSLLVSAQRGEDGQRSDRQKSAQRTSLAERQEQELAQLTKDLSLTAEQQMSIAKLQKALNDAVVVSREKSTDAADRKLKRQEKMKLRKQYDTDLMALLTPKQKKKYEAILKARSEQMQNQGQRPNAGQGGQRGGQGDSDGGGDGE